VFFAVHAFIISSVALWQTWVYKRDYNQKISSNAGSLILTSALGIVVLIAAIYFDYAEWIDLMYYLSYIKLTVSFVKYVPQVYLNYKRQSTVGWSIHNILLDFTGGVLSISQLLLDAYLADDWNGVSEDPAKLGLGLLSIAFDFIFMAQHYIFYRDRTDFYVNSVEEERQRLIAEGRLPKDRNGAFARRHQSDDDGPARNA